ncbi:MAG: 1,4-dihydroxy-2-naphthoate polyprenyltransferase [Porphyromonadaceae bacterium]|nr:1,4-dihydroxy-2-naphthoate polyprenyltransferase [Porphyromonadaceae bacterium]
MAKIQAWINAARPRTWPTSVSPVLAATALAWRDEKASWGIAAICFFFALLAQIASNFGNDYFDYRKGSDKADRIGPRRAVASGEISPHAMLAATITTLGVACILGCLLIPVGGWGLIVAGVTIVIAALAYSAGPYPLSYHGLGDLTVWLFFGLVAVNLSYYVQAKGFNLDVFLCGAAMGLLSDNILIVNNYRDIDDDRAVGKKTTVVLFGKKFARCFYLSNGIIALLLILNIWKATRWIGLCLSLIYLVIHLKSCRDMSVLSGRSLNKVLAATARNQLLFTLLLILNLMFSN